MRLCWTFNSIPELSHLSGQERKAIIRRSMNWPMRIRMFGRPMALACVTLMLYGALAMLIVGATISPTEETFLWIGGAAWWIALSAVFYQLQFRALRRILREQVIAELQGSRLPACLSCNFDLRGTTADKCPECGAPTVIESDG